RTSATLDNVIIDGIAAGTGVMAQFADLTLGPTAPNFTPTDNVSPPGSPSTVIVMPAATQAAQSPPVACDDRFTVHFPDFGNDASRDNNASLRSLELDGD